ADYYLREDTEDHRHRARQKMLHNHDIDEAGCHWLHCADAYGSPISRITECAREKTKVQQSKVTGSQESLGRGVSTDGAGLRHFSESLKESERALPVQFVSASPEISVHH